MAGLMEEEWNGKRTAVGQQMDKLGSGRRDVSWLRGARSRPRKPVNPAASGSSTTGGWTGWGALVRWDVSASADANRYKSCTRLRAADPVGVVTVLFCVRGGSAMRAWKARFFSTLSLPLMYFHVASHLIDGG